MRKMAKLRSRACYASVVLWCVIAFGLLASAAQKKVAAGSLFAPEKGRFNILLDGKSVGHEDFEIAASGGGWTAHGTTSMKPPQGASSTVSGTLTLQPDGVPMTYEWSSQAEKSNSAHVLFANGVAKMTLQLQGARPFEQDLSFSSPLIVVLDNNLYHQYAVLANTAAQLGYREISLRMSAIRGEISTIKGTAGTYSPEEQQRLTALNDEFVRLAGRIQPAPEAPQAAPQQ